MRITNRVWLLPVVAVVAAAALASCVCCGASVEVGEMVTETSTVDIESAESVTVFVDVGICDLTIEAGADALMDAEFRYNVADWKPVVEYTESGKHGELTIRQSKTRGNVKGDAECEWHLRLSDSVPLTIVLDIGVGTTELDLARLTIEDLDVDAGVGDVVVSVGESQEHDVSVGIDNGVGDVVLRLPDRASVSLDCDVGIGSLDAGNLVKRHGEYVTETYDRAGPSVSITVDMGVGDVRVEGPGPGRRI